MTADRHVANQAVELLRAALPSHQDTQDAAYRVVVTASAELGLDLTSNDARHLARVVVGAVEAGIHLRGVELAYLTVDRWAEATNRYLIQPAICRAVEDPFRAAVLADLQQQYLGICETRREVATVLLNLGHRWLAQQHPTPQTRDDHANRGPTSAAPPASRPDQSPTPRTGRQL